MRKQIILMNIIVVLCLFLELGYSQETSSSIEKTQILSVDFLAIRNQYKENKETMTKIQFKSWWQETKEQITGKMISSQGYVKEGKETWTGKLIMRIDIDPPSEAMSAYDIELQMDPEKDKQLVIAMNKEELIKFVGVASNFDMILGSLLVTIENVTISEKQSDTQLKSKQPITDEIKEIPEQQPTSKPKIIKDIKELPKTFVNSINMQFVLIPARKFRMGRDCPSNAIGRRELGCEEDEIPQHEVTLTTPFYIGRYEVNQRQWVAVMGKNPSKFNELLYPVEHVSWNDVQQFINKLNNEEGINTYRLPTEAEWEYAARANSTTDFSWWSDGINEIKEYAWCNAIDFTTHAVGSLRPNAWGLYDVHGNVAEWVQDWYSEDYYTNSPLTDPLGPSEGKEKVCRGGAWKSLPIHCRSARRAYASPNERNEYIGFRVVVMPGIMFE